jgi:hypothetical protein
MSNPPRLFLHYKDIAAQLRAWQKRSSVVRATSLDQFPKRGTQALPPTCFSPGEAASDVY